MLHFIPNRLDQDFEKIADDLDIFFITGGDDRAIRRTTELKLATEMMKRQKPIVGICHGAFLLTDVLGGVVSKKDGHRGGIEHAVTYDGQQHMVNSFHGLCIKSIHTAPNARVLATDVDGDIESWIDGNVAAVAWHPERMDNHWIPDEINTLLGL